MNMNGNIVKLIVGVLTYNLEKYVEQALDSILAQKTDFDFKIIVVDDFSTDNTRTILQKYILQYPEKIEVIFKEKNEGCLAASNVLFSHIKSPYFAFLDGDDFWLDENYLQRGVDFLEKNIEYSMYGNNTVYLVGKNQKGNTVKKKQVNKSYELIDLLDNKCPYVHPSALICRNIIFKDGVPKEFLENELTEFNSVYRGDNYRFWLLLQKGKLFVSNKFVSAYRIHSQGIWQGASEFTHYIEFLLYKYVLYSTYPQYREKLEKEFLEFYNRFMHFLIRNKELTSKFNFTEKEYENLSFLLSLIHNDKSINWDRAKCIPPKNMKYKIYVWLYHKLYNKLSLKGYI